MQQFLNALPYNMEPPPGRATLRSFRGVVRHGTAHCLEAALAAAVILEQHGYPPLVLSFESIDELDHVIFVYRQHGRWGSVARSRDPGLHGRRPVFATPRALALSYVDPYVDDTGRVTGVRGGRPARARPLRLAAGRHQRLEGGAHAARLPAPAAFARRIARYRRCSRRYRAFRTRFPGRKPLYYRGREAWTEIPRSSTARKAAAEAPDRGR